MIHVKSLRVVLSLRFVRCSAALMKTWMASSTGYVLALWSCLHSS